MFLSAVLAANIESELTLFVVAGLSLTQLFYIPEIGALILKSKIPPHHLGAGGDLSAAHGDNAADHRLHGAYVFLLSASDSWEDRTGISQVSLGVL